MRTDSPSTTFARDVVLADGSFVTASEDEHADLFWALRGGGGNFGVVTELEFDLHPVDTIHGGPMFFGVDVTDALLKTYRAWIAAAPRTMGAFPAFPTTPPFPFISQDRVGEPFALLVSCFNGRDEEAEVLLKELYKTECVRPGPFHDEPLRTIADVE